MNAPGFYGKLASRGDFVQRGLPATFSEPWDAWLDAGMAASQQALGSAWLAAYVVSPLWRFVIASGLLDSEAVAGVMMPSIDRVGRHFPLSIAVLLPADTDLGALVSGPDDWFERAELLLLSTLQAETELEGFEAGVDVLGAPACQLRIPGSRGEDGSLRCVVDAPTERGAVLAQLACEGSSCWWAASTTQVAGMLLCYRGMPSAQRFADFLHGQGEVHACGSA